MYKCIFDMLINKPTQTLNDLYQKSVKICKTIQCTLLQLCAYITNNNNCMAPEKWL